MICEASKQGLVAVLQPEEKNRKKPNAYASRVLTYSEPKYSKNALELLAVVWSLGGRTFQKLGIQNRIWNTIGSKRGNKCSKNE